ncbi:MAG: c-type cytochrome [Hoeflea sp.]|uniref:c-type cytochrome n=1 Tax=Hoeflea sp. TaxID=1940281 RepID=UPI001E11B9BA|nr:c-type cytochrome [Hoeflea sp.]MBU4528796.1 c-type cytochrome [Alphaproteobacteria bacterium]MBU4545877.1 c-type cytochrome [Alphaproteobacteria bacterium]MBU4549930.1 c-type cytochrome [Alphaproteobacteria bacterium]MBV1725927.1 c-type cytochrome [Hoeflea sp.]MBV1762652.1 c-type cytochrome [Hoeflea sp.]
MLKFPKSAAVAVLGLTLLSTPSWAEGDAVAGEKVFKKCSACHAVGDGAKHKVGPELNNTFGRIAGTAEGYKYSNPMIAAGEGGLVWDDATLAEYLANPKGMIKGTKMAFAGLKKDDEIANVLAYLKTFSQGEAASAPAAEEPADAAPVEAADSTPAVSTEPAPAMVVEASKGAFGLGRVAMPEEIAAWDIDIRPDGMGLPEGKGTVAEGDPIFAEKCAVCHGDFGEGAGRWPVLAGGQDTLTRERPEKTIGSYWPYLSTVFDYVRRAMPFGDARSLSDDDVYALTAYLLYLNDVVTEEDFELSNENFSSIRLPNEENFIADDRLSEPHYAKGVEPCMSECKPGPVEITARAQILDVTPDGEGDESTGGGID